MIRLSIHTDIASAKWRKSFPRFRMKMEQAAATAFLNAKKPAAFKNRSFSISVILTNDVSLKKINKRHRGKNKPTNVLSFPHFDMPLFSKKSLDIFPPKSFVPLGDVVLAFETIRKESVAQEKTMESHTLHLVIHGVLHLLGYDHMKSADAKAMEKLEGDILAALGYPDPYHATATQKRPSRVRR